MNALSDVAGFGDASQPRGAPKGWDLLGGVPVPLRQRVRDGVADLLASHGEQGLKCCVPLGQGGRGPFERLRFIRALDEFPDMLVSSEHGNAFNRAFHRRHVEAGVFSGCQPDGVDPIFSQLVDPKGWIGVFAVAPFVLLIDRQRLGGLPIPRKWADLMEPVYCGQVVFSGWRREGNGPYSHLNLFFLLSMAREFGLEGVEKLMANVPSLLHSTQMPRLAGGGASPGGIYVVPWSLASICPRRDQTEVVWPEDGALAFPLWMTVKETQRQRLDFLIRHFHGPELADYLNHNGYPALSSECPCTLPDGASFKWLGWEFLRHSATAGLIKAIRAVATRALEAGSCG